MDNQKTSTDNKKWESPKIMELDISATKFGQSVGEDGQAGDETPIGPS